MSVFNIKNLPEQEQDLSDKPLVMLVDDEIENINVLRQLLEANYQIITGLNGREAIDLIDNMVDPSKIQLIISDQRMPEVTGVEFLAKIVDKMPDTIRILLTGYSDTQVIIDAINKVKLYKFITKPFDPVELSLTVQRGVEAFQMRQSLQDYTENLELLVVERTEELNEKNEELLEALTTLETLSLTDQLTGVHNRHFLKKFLPGELAKLERDSESTNSSIKDIGIVMIDIDFFKHVNDTYGHDAGDKVLIDFTAILKDVCRESDWIVRWGGEEFVIIVRGSTLKELQTLAERIRVHVEQHQFDLGCQQSINRTCSIGVTTYPFINNQVNALSWQQTLNFADLALYAAKNNGRNSWISLFDNNVDYQDDFYETAMTNLKTLIDSNIVGFNSLLSRDDISF